MPGYLTAAPICLSQIRNPLRGLCIPYSPHPIPDRGEDEVDAEQEDREMQAAMVAQIMNTHSYAYT